MIEVLTAVAACTRAVTGLRRSYQFSVLGRATIAALIAVAVVGSAQAQTFTHAEIRSSGLFSQISAVADFNGDGLDDVVLTGYREHDEEPDTPEDRLQKAPMRMYFGTSNGRFRVAPAGQRYGLGEVREAVTVTEDFNGDGRPDLAVFDSGIYYWEVRQGVGNPPQLYLTADDDRMVESTALADAVRRANERNPDADVSGPEDLHIKTVAAGDIDGDGDVDLWVESDGGWNMESHFMINEGAVEVDEGEDIRFEVVIAPYELLSNPPPEYWRYDGASFFDADGDGDLDLALGQLRDDQPSHINQSSIILINDGTGQYTERVMLPQPQFYQGYTAVQSIGVFDLDDNGFDDLFLMHTRNDDLTIDTDDLPFTGRYMQALMNQGDLTFIDETVTRFVDQDETLGQLTDHGEPLSNTARRQYFRDVDGDGCLDLVLGDLWAGISEKSPIAYVNNGRGQFRPMSPEPLLPDESNQYFGQGAWPADVNGDGLIDFVSSYEDWGPDEEPKTQDDETVLVVTLNTTGLQPIRCE